jgi:hypothetical protein
MPNNAATTRKAAHVPPPPKTEPELLLVLLPNILLPVVLLLEPNMLVPVLVFEPKPEAEGKLDTVCREAVGARRRAHRGRCAKRSPRIKMRGCTYHQNCCYCCCSNQILQSRWTGYCCCWSQSPQSRKTFCVCPANRARVKLCPSNNARKVDCEGAVEVIRAVGD